MLQTTVLILQLLFVKIKLSSNGSQAIQREIINFIDKDLQKDNSRGLIEDES